MPAKELNSKIDEFVSETQKLIGQKVQERAQWNTIVNADAIRHFAWGIGDSNPLWVDMAYAKQGPYERLVAPPAFLTSVLYPILHGAPLDVPLLSLIGGLEFQWLAPILEGDTLCASAKYTGVFDRKDSAGRRFIYVMSETTYWNQEEREVGKATGTMVRLAQAGSELLVNRDIYRYQEDELADIQKALVGQVRTGGQEMPQGILEPGNTLPPFVRGPLTIGDLVCWQAAIGPSYRAGPLGYVDGLSAPHTTVINPVTGWPVKYSQQHEDFLLASQRGMPAPFDNGIMRFACLTPMLTDWMGDRGFLKRLSVQILAPNLYGDTTWYEGRVTKKIRQTSGDLVSLKITGTNQIGVTTTTGNAEVFIPYRPSISIVGCVTKSEVDNLHQPHALDIAPAHERVEEWSTRTPHAIALVCQDQELTYGQLNAQANRLSHYLRFKGVDPGTLVGVFLDRSPKTVVTSLAILKAGGTYVPLDPEYPSDRLNLVLKESQVSMVLTTMIAKKSLPNTSAKILCVDELDSELSRFSEEDPVNIFDPNSMAYVMYTSGSTDQPRGVSIPHASLARYLDSLKKAFEVTSEDVALHTASFSFSAATRQMWFPLSVGATLVVATSEQCRDPNRLFELMQHRAVTVWDTVPTFLRLCTETLAARHKKGDRTFQKMRLRLLLVTGEPLPWELAHQWRSLFPNHPAIHNLYSQTETAGTVCQYRLPSKISDRSGVVPLGYPLDHTRIYLLNDQLQEVSKGEAGEICVGNDRLAWEYRNSPELTSRRFIRDPFSISPEARLYRTGDLARYRPDGALEFVGRCDHRVKIRGFRIDPQEVEKALLIHGKIQEAAVVSQKDSNGHDRLVGYVVPTREASSTIYGFKRYVLPNNLAIAQLHKHETDFTYQTVFEKQTYLKYGISIQDGDCIFDVGANIGLFSLFIQLICPEAKIFSFEPNPQTFQVLQANTSLSNSSIKLFNIGLSDGKSSAQFTSFNQFSLMSGFYTNAENDKEVVRALLRNHQRSIGADETKFQPPDEAILESAFSTDTFTVPMQTLSHVIEQEHISTINLLKINVEKSEVDVLRGIKEADWAKIQQLVIKVDTPDNLNMILALLESHGYEVKVDQDPLLHQTNINSVYAIRPNMGKILLKEQAENSHIRSLPLLSSPFVSGEELKAFLSQQLPHYMVPSIFVNLESLPLMPNGKVDRGALSPPDQMGSQSEDPTFAPQSPLESLLGDLWKELLGIKAVSVSDNFLNLGGDSILAIRFMNQLETRTEVRITFAALMLLNLGELARYCEECLMNNDQGEFSI